MIDLNFSARYMMRLDDSNNPNMIAMRNNPITMHTHDVESLKTNTDTQDIQVRMKRIDRSSPAEP